MLKDAFYFLIPLAAAAGVAAWLGWWPAGLLLGGLAAFVAFFFRDPHRIVPDGPGLIVAPADGRVVRVESHPDRIEISIFLSLFNVHVNRSPIEGQIESVRYRKGAFHAAYRDVASVQNEQNTLTIASPDFKVSCSQIAGVVARRIICWKAPGDRVGRGERIGFIRFGSRVDLVLPGDASLRVAEGTRVRGGSSTIAALLEVPK